MEACRGLRDEGHLPAHLRWLGPGCAHRRVTVGALDWQLPGGRPEALAPVQTAAPQVPDERGVQQAQSKQTVPSWRAQAMHSGDVPGWVEAELVALGRAAGVMVTHHRSVLV